MSATLRCGRELASVDGVSGKIPKLVPGPRAVYGNIQLVVTDRDAAFPMRAVEELGVELFGGGGDMQGARDSGSFVRTAAAPRRAGTFQ
jgi:hypothetical protein